MNNAYLGYYLLYDYAEKKLTSKLPLAKSMIKGMMGLFMYHIIAAYIEWIEKNTDSLEPKKHIEQLEQLFNREILKDFLNSYKK